VPIIGTLVRNQNGSIKKWTIGFSFSLVESPMFFFPIQAGQANQLTDI